jgi:YVTN family beta-propeller protein
MKLGAPINGLLLAAIIGCGDDGGGQDPADAGPDAEPPFEVNATLVDAPPDGRLPAGQLGDGTAILPGGRLVTPLGRQVELGGFLLGVRLLPGGAHVITTDGGYYDEYLSVVDLATGTIVQQEPFRENQGGSLFLGLAIRSDGRVFASGGGSDVIVSYDYDAGAALPLTQTETITLAPGSYVAGLAFLDDTRLLAGLQVADALAMFESTTGAELGRLTFGNGDEPYDVAVAPARQEAYVSLWGDNSIVIVDVSGPTPTLAAKILVGKNPEALLLDPPASPTRLLVANSDSDSVSVIDLDTRTVIDEVSVAPTPASPRGSAPNHLALSPDGSRLYVANAGENCVDVLSTADFTRIGRFPTAWYPTAVGVLPSGGLVITNAKGLGGGPSDGTHFDYGIMKGTLSILDAEPTEAELAAAEADVAANNDRPRTVGPRVMCPASGECRWPLPPEPGLPTPIRHVVLVVRENKTYDVALGDLEGAEGDPSLVLFGEFYTPNLHALARTFVNGDNYYSNAEASIQGHQWTAAGTTTDFTEKAWLTTWGRGERNIADFGKEISSPEPGYYFQHMGRAGIDYINYGEIVGIAADGPDVELDPQWPGGLVFNLASRDVDKAEYFRSRVQDEGFLPRFTYMLLPNNHTEGLEPGKWTPEYMVADNDEATGRVVDAVSHSPFWPHTVVFIIEDDPQDGADHVEAHRSTLVIASPWVRRGHVVKTHYDVPSLWRTIELLVGLPPMSQSTASASPMFDIWAAEPDLTPFTYVPSNVPESFNPATRTKLAEQSEKMDFTTLDNAPGLGRVLWEHMKGEPAPWSSMPLPPDWDEESDSDSD